MTPPGRPLCIVCAATAMLLLCGASTIAADRFVRPLGQAAGDGSSYAQAWNGFGAVDWTSLGPGDTLRICGTHAYAGDNRIDVASSGAAGAPLIMTGDCASPSGPDPGVVFAVHSRFAPGTPPAGSWTDTDGDGVFQAPYGGCTGSFLLEEEAGFPLSAAHPGARLRWAQDDFVDPMAQLASWAPGSFFQPDCGQPLFVKPRDPGPPARYLGTANSGDIFFIANRSHLVIRDLKLYSSHSRAILLDNADHVLVENNDIRWGAINVDVTRDSDDGIIRNNEIHDTISVGIAFLTGGVDANLQSNDRWLVQRNEIHEISRRCNYCARALIGLPSGDPRRINPPDRHGMGIQGGGSGNIFELNHIHHAGGEGIVIYNWSNLAGGNPQRDNVIRWNYIHDVEDLSPNCVSSATPVCANQRGIELGSDSRPADPDTITGNIVYGNVLARIKQLAFRTKSTRPASGFTWRFLNNTIIDSGSALQFVVWDPNAAPNRVGGAEFRNNLVFDAVPDARPHVEAALNGGAQPGHTLGFAMSNNLYYPDGPTEFRWGTSASSPSSDLAGWEQLSGIEELNSLTSHPQLNDPTPSGDFYWAGTPSVIPGGGDFRPIDTSPCIDAGLPAAGLWPDLTDIAANPIVDVLDLGAYELVCVAPLYDGYLALQQSAGGTEISWTAGAPGFDLVRGDLAALAASAGNFTAALDAIDPLSDVCMLNDAATTSIVDTKADPPAGGGWFYLVRGVAACGAPGSYDSTSSTQVGGRDAEIAAATGSCP